VEAAGQMVGDLDRGAQYSGTARPQSDISMYTTTDEQYEVRQVDGEIDMEPLDKERVYRQYHPGALIVYDGERYEVQRVVEDTYQPFVELHSKRSRNYTQAIHDKSITGLDIDRCRDLGEGVSTGCRDWDSPPELQCVQCARYVRRDGC